MSQKKHTEPSPSKSDPERLLERPDGFYWRDRRIEKLHGPFPNVAEAEQDMQSQESILYHEAESLKQAEMEIGIADWIDPETGEPAEASPPHLVDEG